jgi:hypothetical protein
MDVKSLMATFQSRGDLRKCDLEVIWTAAAAPPPEGFGRRRGKLSPAQAPG